MIARANPLFGPSGTPQIAIVGGGISGIAIAVKLKRAGIHTFTIFEEESALGGTWRVNTYPGANVDVNSAIYSFSFHDHNWPGTHADQSEILQYLEDAAQRHGLMNHFRFSTRIDEVRWHEDTHQYSVKTDAGDVLRFNVVVSAVGFLSDPNMPDWDGLSEFKGEKFHTSSWDHQVALEGKTVAIVGTGSTAVQVIPAIAPVVKHLHVFQREPGWVLPKNQRRYSPDEMRKYSHRFSRKARRWKLFVKMEWGYIGKAVYHDGSRRNRKAKAASLSYIDAVFHNHDQLKEAVTPNYPFSGKRRILSDDYYATLLAPNVELIAKPVVRLTPDGVVDTTGRERKVDVLILSTGFKAASYLSRLEVFGRDGQSLQSVWRDGAFALLGMSLQGFPNFYMLYGPNTNGAGGPITLSSERQASWVVSDVKRMIRKGYTAIETKASYVAIYNNWLQRRLSRTAWARSNNYMKAPSGRIVTQFDGGMIEQWVLLHALNRPSSYGRRPQTHR